MKQYIIRSIKYFFYYCILLVLIMTILTLLGVVEANVGTMFKNGYNSLWQIALFFAVMSALYPRFGFTKRSARISGDFSEIKDGVIEYMSAREYKLESQEGENFTFRYRSPVTRIMRMCEDRITMTRELGGFQVEGPTKDITRVISGLEYKFRNPEED